MCGGMVKMGLSFVLVSLLLASVALTYSFSRVGGGVHLKAITLKETGNWKTGSTKILWRFRPSAPRSEQFIHKNTLYSIRMPNMHNY